jgi:hypothetical protein
VSDRCRELHRLIVPDGSRTVPIGTVKIQVNVSVSLGGHNKNQQPMLVGPVIAVI